MGVLGELMAKNIGEPSRPAQQLSDRLEEAFAAQ